MGLQISHKRDCKRIGWLPQATEPRHRVRNIFGVRWHPLFTVTWSLSPSLRTSKTDHDLDHSTENGDPIFAVKRYYVQKKRAASYRSRPPSKVRVKREPCHTYDRTLKKTRCTADHSGHVRNIYKIRGKAYICPEISRSLRDLHHETGIWPERTE